ncbi:PREDICTED: putative U-box domain-containing protein 58 [Tarenaya hassleriana]|uniref:putative U-box domain-containing protein 58 n=1 Tax=Tarenaya hassleriana TaxID=28532 RepID=UPI00053C5FAB|nr:PREDICTED: putative U-box domain-containing protein 58 [Tarenaya hassleriana]
MDPLIRYIKSFTGADEPGPSCRSENLAEEMGIQEKVKSLLDSLTRWNFGRVKDQLVQAISGAMSPSVLQFLVTCIFDMAIEDDAFGLFGRLCAELSSELPPIPSHEALGRDISFKRILLNKCQMEFETSTDSFKFVGAVRFVAELFKSRLVTEKICHRIIQELISCPDGRNLQALCCFLSSIGKQVDSSPKSRRILDIYFVKLEEIVQSTELTPCSRDMIIGLQCLRANNWVGKDRGAEKKQEISYGSTSTASNGSSETDSSEDLGSLLDKILKEIRTLKLDVRRDHLLRVEAEKKADMLERKYQNETRLRKKNQGMIARERAKMRLVLETFRKERDDALEITQHLLAGETDARQTPPSFFCPITQEVMKDPQVAADGFTYEAEAIRKWIDSGHDTSPITNLKLSHLALLPNHALRSVIREEWHK